MATKNELTFEKVSSHSPTRGCTPFSVSTFGATISVFSFQRIRYHSIELPLTLRFWGCLLVRLFLGGTLRTWKPFLQHFWPLPLPLAYLYMCCSLVSFFHLVSFHCHYFSHLRALCKAFSKRFMQASRVSGALLSTTGTLNSLQKRHQKKEKRKK